MRRDESAERAGKRPWKRNDRNSVAGRDWYDWLPIFELTEGQAFETIAVAGQTPHPVYAQGLTRCSCSFCILASRADLTRAAQLRPDLYARYVALEQRLDHTLSPSRRTLPEITGIPAPRGQASRLRLPPIVKRSSLEPHFPRLENPHDPCRPHSPAPGPLAGQHLRK